MDFRPAYLDLLDSGELDRRVQLAHEHQQQCDLCAWMCHANRFEGQVGSCRAPREFSVASYFPHLGEEEPIRGWRGSGTVFFSHCNLNCQYCQNHEIAHSAVGQPTTCERLVSIMLSLQAAGCHNINLVSPSHVVAPIIEAVALAARMGLTIPLVYNTGGYDSPAALALLDGIIDIYMPDMKYGDSSVAKQYSKVPHYWESNQEAVREMHRQVGDLRLDRSGVAQRGLLVRHLVLPDGLAGTNDVMRFLAEEISRDTYVNIMSQYRPEYRATAPEFAPLNRRVHSDEVSEAFDIARSYGLYRFDGLEQLAALAI
ncbi:MAG: radical SAM protein [Chloroflexi bacterium]|nr:radical SAM protein [Chloroflexota bacterium]